jgi:putative ABC transport system permease protein
MKYLPLLWAGLFRKKTRTILTLLSVCIAFLLFGLLQAITMAFESGADSADARRLLTTARYSIIELLPRSYLQRIEQVPGVVGVAALGIAVVLALAISLHPALRVWRLQIVEALAAH